MQNGWRSPIGDWAHPTYGCAELNTLKTYIAELWKPLEWDFFTWFEIIEEGGTMKPHSHFEHQRVVHYLIAGSGQMLFEQGNKGASINLLPGEIVTVQGITKNSIPDPVSERRIAVVLNANGVVRL